MKPVLIAFDCFGTVFSMDGVSRFEIQQYVQHVNKNDFTPFDFPLSWWSLKAHPDSEEGIARLQAAGFLCVALSNGSVDLLKHVSEAAGISWDHIVDLASHRVYKPNVEAYKTLEADLGIEPAYSLMVTANPTFGDVEGAAAIGMRSQVIRQPDTPRDIVQLAEELIESGGTSGDYHSRDGS